MSFFIYYILLYLIIISTNFFRLKAEQQDETTPEYKFPWKRIFFISNEIIYTGSGVYIILLENTEWVAPLMALLIFLIIISLYMVSMGERFNDTVKFYTHITIIVIVICGTFFTFIENKDQSLRLEKDSISTYSVIIPYLDKSLIKNYGYDKFGEKKLCYYTKVVGINEEEGKNKAIKQFWNDSLLMPILISKDNLLKKNILTIDESQIIVKKQK